MTPRCASQFRRTWYTPGRMCGHVGARHLLYEHECCDVRGYAALPGVGISPKGRIPTCLQYGFKTDTIVICRFARPPPPFPSARAALAPPGVWHCERRRRRAALLASTPAAAPCRRPQPSSRSPRARASRSSSRRASPRPAIRRVLGRAGPPRRRPPPQLSK